MSWSPGTRVYILLSPKYKNRVEGLCGDFNGNADDDLKKAMASNPQEYGKLFEVGTCPDPIGVLDPCEVIMNHVRLSCYVLMMIKVHIFLSMSKNKICCCLTGQPRTF